uniref:EF-hand domain-containing protein n=1 Tax=Naja naja TaxID=35670 RepID=A0A8C7E266_NAJNA
MTSLEAFVFGTMEIFAQRAITVMPDDTLSKGEFRKLMKEELPNFFQVRRKPFSDADGLFNELDENKDGQLSFKEFTTLVQEALMISYNKLHQDD